MSIRQIENDDAYGVASISKLLKYKSLLQKSPIKETISKTIRQVDIGDVFSTNRHRQCLWGGFD